MDQVRMNSYWHPPASPAGEAPAVGDPQFAASCRADIASIVKSPVDWGAQLFTENKSWGLVWRAEFSEPNRTLQSYPTRVVFWKTDEGGLGTFVSTMDNGILAQKQPS